MYICFLTLLFEFTLKSLFKGLQMCLWIWIWALTAVQSDKSDWLISLSEAKKPPVFDVPLKPATVDDGEKLILRCHVCGSSPLKIQWMKDRKELTPSSSTRISFSDGTACLEISTVSKLNAGDYLCKATNEAGSEFCKAKVTVKGKKKKKKVKSPQICTLRFYLFVIVFISQKLKNSDFCCFWESFICSLSSCRETWSSSVSCWSSSSFSIQKTGQSVLHWRA